VINVFKILLDVKKLKLICGMHFWTFLEQQPVDIVCYGEDRGVLLNKLRLLKLRLHKLHKLLEDMWLRKNVITVCDNEQR